LDRFELWRRGRLERITMKNRAFRRLLLTGLVLAGLLIVVPAAFAAGNGADRQLESGAAQMESLLGQYVDLHGAAPVFTDYGDGFYSLSVQLDPADNDRLLAAVDADGAADKKAPASLTLLAGGQSLSSPTTPTACIHAALSNTTLTYNYWVVVLNLGTQNVTRTTSFKLTGPGLTFNRSFSVPYGANGIWVTWYNPAASVRNPGLYTYVASVTGLGSFTSRSFAINP
jgi:hypothetical protein